MNDIPDFLKGLLNKNTTSDVLKERMQATVKQAHMAKQNISDEFIAKYTFMKIIANDYILILKGLE